MVQVNDVLRDNDPRRPYRFLKVVWINPLDGMIHCEKLTSADGSLVTPHRMRPINPDRIGPGVRGYRIVEGPEDVPQELRSRIGLQS